MGDDAAKAAREVIVYTSPLCAPCEALKKFLSGQNVEYKVRDLMMEEDAQDRLDEAGIRSTPALEIDGQLYAGDALNPQNVKDLLNL
jgi:glutaredoxin-like protein NrdH